MGRSAAVIGAGIGGLTVAARLIRDGWDVDLYERSESLPRTGSALGMWPDAMKVFDALGISAEIRAAGRAQEAADIRDHRGRLLAGIPSRGETVMISRVALLRVLADAAAQIHFATPVDSPQDLPHDVVICADGISSAGRSFVAPSAPPARDLGVSVVIAQFPGTTEMFTEYWGPGASFGVTPLSADRCDWHAAYRAPIQGSPGAMAETRDPLTFVRDRYRDWSADVSAAIDEALPESVLTYRVRTVPRFRQLHRDRVVLIGDAVHAMAPNLGRGACETILDAAAVADELAVLDTTHHSSVHRSFDAYERRRRSSAHRIAAASRIMCRLGMLHRTAPVRDAVMRLAPG